MSDNAPENLEKKQAAPKSVNKLSREQRLRDIEARVDDALSAIEDLAELLMEENEAVLGRDDESFLGLQDEKVLLVE